VPHDSSSVLAANTLHNALCIGLTLNLFEHLLVRIAIVRSAWRQPNISKNTSTVSCDLVLKIFLKCALHVSALTLLVGRQEGHPACKNSVVGCWCGCLERGADLHMAQLMPLPVTVSCFSKIQIGFTFLVPAYPGSPGKRAVKRVCVCVCFTCKRVTR